MRRTAPATVSPVVSRLAIMALTAWTLSGCFLSTPADNADTTTMVPAQSPQADATLSTLIRQAADSTKALSSVHLLLSTTGKIDGLGRISAANLDVEVAPLRATGTVTYDGQLDVPFRLADDKVAVNLFNEWTVIGSVSDLFPPGLIDPSAGVAQILGNITDPQSQGTEAVDGIPATRITGTVPPETAKTMLPQAKSATRITVWIRPDGNHELVRSLVDVSPGNTVQNTLSKWNVPVARTAS